MTVSLKSQLILGDWHRLCHWYRNWFLGTGTGCVNEIKIDFWGLVHVVSLKSKSSGLAQVELLKSNFILGDWHRLSLKSKLIDSWGLVQVVSLKPKMILGDWHGLSLKSNLILGDWHRLSLKSKLILGDWHRLCHWNQNRFLGTGRGCVIEIENDPWGLAQVVSLKSKMILEDWHRLSLKSQLVLGDWHRLCHWKQNWFLGIGTSCVIEIKILGTGKSCVIEIKINSWGLAHAVIEIKTDFWGLAQAVSLKLNFIFGDWRRLWLWNQNWFLGTGTGCIIEIKILGTGTSCVIEIKIDFGVLAQAVLLKSTLILGDWHRLCHWNQNWFLGAGTGCVIEIKIFGTGTGCVIEIKINSWGLA